MPFDEASVDARLRAALEARLEAEGLAALAEELRRVAPTIAAHTDLANPRRVVRALERARLVGDTLPEPPRGYPGPMTWLGLHVGAEIGRQRILNRAAGQFASGLVEEAVALRARFGTPPRAFSAFGYFEALDLADGRLDRRPPSRGPSAATLAYRTPPADLVPRRARHRLAAGRGGPPADGPERRPSAARRLSRILWRRP